MAKDEACGMRVKKLRGGRDEWEMLRCEGPRTEGGNKAYCDEEARYLTSRN